MTAIDNVLPHYDAHEVHSIAYGRSLKEALATPVAADPFVRLLFRLRGVPAGGGVAVVFGRLALEELARGGPLLVYGAARAASPVYSVLLAFIGASAPRIGVAA